MFAVLAASLAALPVTVTKNVAYRTAPAVQEGGAPREVALDFYAPVTAAEGPHAMVVVIHGGSWSGGARQDVAPFCENLSRMGIASATVSYRLAPTDKWPAMVDDVRAAVRFLRANAKDYNIDPARFGAAGVSAGGHLALLLGTMDDNLSEQPNAGHSSRVKAVVNLFGPTDLSQDYPELLRAVLSQTVLGKPLSQAGDAVKTMSPVNWITPDDAPVFTIHGKTDQLVPVRQATRLEEAMKKANVGVETVLIEGMGHELPLERPEVSGAMTRALNWLQQRL
jgi:acetyl esterase/lipase